MSNQSMDEKQEQDEKREEKDEKEVQKREEKTLEEKYRNDPLNTVTWAAILIWAGLAFLAQNMGWLAQVSFNRLPEGWNVGSLEAWTVIFIGAGVILLINALARVLIPAYRSPIGGTIVLAAVFMGIGLGNLFGWAVVWPIILIAAGLSILLRGMVRRK
jgi:hypothetical protein